MTTPRNPTCQPFPSLPPQSPVPFIPPVAVVREAALACRRAGLSVIPIAPDGTKAPAWQLLPAVQTEYDDRPRHSWKGFQTRLATEDEIGFWFSLPWGSPCGLAVIGGAISGGLEIIDFDTADLFQPWSAWVQEAAPGLLERLVLIQTPRPGVHVYSRSQSAEGNQKLAVAHSLDDKGQPTFKTLIETRGEGGYVLVPPSPSLCHPSGRPYILMTGRGLTDVPTISVEERRILFEAARRFDQTPLAPSRPVAVRPARPQTPQGNRPGDHFNARASWEEVLEPHGWVCVSVDATGLEHWRRPGKTQGTSATVNYAGADLLHVFSQNASPFEAGHSYSKFSAFALLQHHGDFRAAAAALEAQGYGQPRLPFGRRPRPQSQARTPRRRRRR